MSLASLIATWGVAAVFVGCAAEGETSAFLGGVMAHRGLLGWGEMVAAAAAGSLMSDQGFYWAGRRFSGHRRIRRLLARPEAGRVRNILHARPRLFVLGFRFVPGMRIAGPLAIGATGIAPRIFVPLNILSGIGWAMLVVTLGYHFGRVVEALFGRLHLVPLITLAAGAALLLLGLLRWLRR